jgi:hypothetical protein
MDNAKIKEILEKEMYSPVSDTITLNYISMLARSTDDDLMLAAEVRRMLGVPPSRQMKPKTNSEYLPCPIKL